MKKLSKENLYKSILMILLAVICLAGAVIVLFYWHE